MRVAEVRALPVDAPPAPIDVAGVDVLCGFPSPAQDYVTSEIDLNDHLMPNRVSMFLVRARGHSMVRTGIFDGDDLIVDRSVEAKSGHVVVAVVDGEMTVKRLRLLPDGSVILSAENPHHPNIEIAELSELQVWGVVSRSLHGLIPARTPAPDHQTSELDLNEYLMPNRVSTFLIRARGHSMVRAGISDGDELIVDRSILAQDGHVVVAVVDGEMTVKRLSLLPDGSVILSAENPQHPNIEIAELSELRVWGVATRSLHRVLRG